MSAIGATVRMMAQPLMSRSARKEMDIASWYETEALTRDGLPGDALDLTGLSEDEAAELAAALNGDEVQGALQVLLAARLTDAPEIEAAKAREAVRLALATPYAEQLSEYYDDKISSLVAHLEGSVGFAGLSQVRSEAYSSRIVALLGTLTDLVGALADPDRGGQAEADFLIRYRQQARGRHGKLEPPDFDRRRKVPVEKIYVSTRLYIQEPDGRTFLLDPSPHVIDLAEQLDRTVLLGDPGGGKTTAANVLANFFASDATRKVPFLVTLRDYAAKDPPERSVASHIEHILETLYQCPAPDRLVERTLRTGRAVVIFDGLDELLDTARRRDVSERVEQFCAAYPLTPVLVTSRLVGYDQARLDDEQFTCYRLGGFGEDEVAEYARKWFALQDGTTPAAAESEATAFLAESRTALDLRSSPLLLSLMCILYRGAGSLPRDRAGIYGKCAELLFGKWDEQRRIRHELRAADHVEPAIRYLAWWLFTRDDPQTAVTEGTLIDEASGFLHGRAFETEAEARAAAREFVEFCRGRMWVLSDAGTTAEGEKLYSFTHRTFLEYFAAAHLAAVSDTPEDLARKLAPRIAAGEWEVAGQLAIQLKDRTTDRGADRIFAALLDPQLMTPNRARLLLFLMYCLPSARLGPTTVRSLTRAAIGGLPDGGKASVQADPLMMMLSNGASYEQVIGDEVSGWIGAAVSSDNKAARTDALQLALEIGMDSPREFWRLWSREEADRYAPAIVTEAASSGSLRTLALETGVISIDQALAMPGGFSSLMDATYLVTGYRDVPSTPYPVSLCEKAIGSDADSDTIDALAAIGRHILANPALPWVRVVAGSRLQIAYDARTTSTDSGLLLDEAGWLGFSATMCAFTELSGRFLWKQTATQAPQDVLTGPALLLDRYITRRERRAGVTSGNWRDLTPIPVPEQFRQLFQGWADRRVDFVEILQSMGR